tara:strand:+ start:5188 stop:6951 length:1764 start_codon:yes stop_codon:yes gene_type:complete
MLKDAIKLHKSGFKIIPVRQDKTPACRWSEYRKSQNLDDIKKLFASHTEGLAIITGDGLEVIDIDLKYSLDPFKFLDDICNRIIETIGLQDYESLIFIHTQNRGFHIYYKTDVVEGNQKLASRYTTDEERTNPNDNTRVLIETRGHGGYVVAPPTNGYKYDAPARTLEQIPFLTDFKRNKLIKVLKEFNQTDEHYKRAQISTPLKDFSSNKTTIEAFNDSHTCREIIEANGWKFQYTQGQNDLYRRPNKDKGVSGGYSQSLNLFYCFTSSTELEPNKAFNPFQLYTFFNHSGDYSAASKELYKIGYGDRLEKQDFKKQLNIISDEVRQKEKNTDSNLMQSIFNTNFDIHIKPTIKPSTLFLVDPLTNKETGIGGEGEIITFLGLQKSRKSAIASAAASCFIQGVNSCLNFRAAYDGKKIVHIDTEQGEYDYYKTCETMLNYAGHNNQNANNFYSFRLTNYTTLQKVQFLDYIVNKLDDIGCLFLDGIVDLCKDYNDLKEGREIVQYVRRLCSKHSFLLMNVLHNARSTGKARGHLGTELLNKGKCNINIVKDKEGGYSTLTIDDLRGAHEPQGFDFSHNHFGQLEIV